jgi:tRNA U34 5-methylaminomethyl-2-thiouridine-forming methyltransferase MnmC
MSDLKREIIVTKDGSHSLLVPELNEQYHSIHGAKQEADHVFLKMGLGFHFLKDLKVFEVGFGTGLNALLTWDYAARNSIHIEYHSIEKYPVAQAEYEVLNYGTILHKEEAYLQLHQASWEELNTMDAHFSLHKLEADLKSDVLPKGFDVIYFDAFAPNKQANMWTEEIFRKMLEMLNEGGCLVTYCCQGHAKRAMKAAGFDIEKVPGPPGKREMLRAKK